MNVVLWVVQGFLAFAFGAAGAFKLVTPRKTLILKKLGWAADFSDSQVKLIGLAEVLGAIGLVVPWATGILPVLTPLAALCLAVIMGGAVAVHVRRKETPVPPLVLGILSAALAGLRF